MLRKTDDAAFVACGGMSTSTVENSLQRPIRIRQVSITRLSFLTAQSERRGLRRAATDARDQQALSQPHARLVKIVRNTDFTSVTGQLQTREDDVKMR